MKTILITGATGFVGTYLATNLLSRHDCHVIGTSLSGKSTSQENLEIVTLNLLDGASVEKLIVEKKPDEIYHLAALSSPKQSFINPSETMTNNITAEVNILEALRKNNMQSTKVLITSSAEVYGLVSQDDLPIDENTALNPTNPYAVSKIAQDFLGLQYHLSYKLHVIRVRPFNHIGPGQTPQFVVAAFAKRIVDIEKGTLDVLTVGSLDAKRDFTDVRDMIVAYELLMQKGVSGEVYNIGSGISHKISEILDILLSFVTKKITVQRDVNLLLTADNPELVCDPSKMKAITGWEPKISIQQTLKDTLDYWRNIE